LNLTLFDLDNTLLSGDSDFEWAQFLIEQGVLDREVYEARNNEFYEQYKNGTLDIHAFLDFQLKPLARHPRRVLDEWHAEFMQKRIRPIMRPRARELIERHRGDLCAIVTATNSFVTRPIAAEFRIAHLVATEPESVEGRFTGRVAGTPCFREGKIDRVADWLAGLGLELNKFASSTFYSDSHNDLPLLERVTRPVVVDPDPQLEAEAARRGWQRMSLRPQVAVRPS